MLAKFKGLAIVAALGNVVTSTKFAVANSNTSLLVGPNALQAAFPLDNTPLTGPTRSLGLPCEWVLEREPQGE